FRRRALAVSHWDGKLVALGGMNENRKISRRVDALDFETGEWTKLAKLPGEGMDGFGAAACNINRKLYASGTQESLYRLSDDGKKWKAVMKLSPPRFFHRLVPGEQGYLLAVGGASEEGHLATIEQIDPDQ
ncbi:MAG TPA: kelch repeat-containing protein, partial [Lacipirellula sp.]